MDSPRLFPPFRTWRGIVRESYRSWRAHRTSRLAAGLAYYGLFAVVPLLTVSVALAGILLDDIDTEEVLAEKLSDVFGTDASSAAESIASTVDRSGTYTGLGLVGLGSLVFASSLVFVALQDAFDTIWEVPVGTGARNLFRRRALAFAVVLASGAVLVANFAIGAISGLVRQLAPGDYAVLELSADAIGALGSWGLAAVVLALLFSILTRPTLHWRVALLGGLVTSVALTIGNRVVAEYLGRWGASSLVGVVGAVFVVLVWIYAIAQILLVGAELTRTLHTAMDPVPDARVTGSAR